MISLIFAIDENNLIGKNNDLPWHFKEDLEYFKKTTLNHTVLMGRKTFESIVNRLNKPLPKRKNVVASKHGFSYPDVMVIHDLKTYLENIDEEEVFVIGGKSIYEVAFPYAKKLYITFIKGKYEGDTYLNFDLSDFELVSKDERENLIFAIFERRD